MGTARGLPPPASPPSVVLVHQLLDVRELLVKVLETGVGLLAGGVCPGAGELGLDLGSHNLEIEA